MDTPHIGDNGNRGIPKTRRQRRSVADYQLHLLDYVEIVYRYRYQAVSTFLLVALAVILRTYTATPLYRTAARVMVEMEDQSTVAIAGAVDGGGRNVYWQDPKIYRETQHRILKGSELAHRVVRRLDLAHVPEFNQPGQPAPSESTLVGRFGAQVVIELIPESSLIDVGFVSTDPSFAVRAADTLAEEYVQQNLELRKTSVTKSLEWLAQELANQQKTVEASERALAEYREKQDVSPVGDPQNITVARLSQLNDAVTRAKTSRVQKETLFHQIEGVEATVAGETIPAILQNPFIQTIKTRIAELQHERATLLERYGSKHPNVIKVNSSLQGASQQLQEELAKAMEAIRNDYRSAVAEERTLTAALEDQKREVTDLNRKGVGYSALERQVRSDRQVYESLRLREKELHVMASSRGNNVRITDRAELPGTPVTPTLERDIRGGLLAATALSLGFVFFLNYLNDTVKNPDDVIEGLNVRLLGLAPKVNGAQLLISRDVSPQFGEAFRSVRTSLITATAPQNTRIVMVTSAHPFEGKTTTACNLALALAIDGARILLIDADTRRPGVHRMLSLPNRKGLSEVLSGRATLKDALVTFEQVDVITAGAPPPNPSELLGSPQMEMLLQETRNGGEYDWILIDTPPVLAVTDAVVLSRLVTGIAFVIRSDATRRDHAALALETLQNTNPCQLGVVLNRVDFKRNKYYYRRYQGYQNANYYYGAAPLG